MKPTCFFIGTSWGEKPAKLHYRALAEELVARGHRVVLLVNGQTSAVESHTSNPAVYSWPSKRPTKLKDAVFLSRLIHQYHPECVLANFGAVNWMLLLGWAQGVPHRVAWYHTTSKAVDLGAHSGVWQLKLLRLRKTLVYKFATMVLAVSQAAAEDLQRVFHVPRSKCRVFYNSLTDPQLSLQLKNCITVPQRVVCVGTMSPIKGQDVLLRAVGLLRRSLPELRVELIGGGPSLGEYQRLAAELRVSDICCFAGALPHAEVLQRMAQAAVTVVPSRSEAFGLVGIESFAVGTPVVASAVGGIPEVVRDGEDGFLVQPDNPVALAEKLQLLLTDAPLRSRFGCQARERFHHAFEQRTSVKTQAEWLQTLLASRVGGPKAPRLPIGSPLC
jgi:glycosyltransferase involved in cell wall biosynthesis